MDIECQLAHLNSEEQAATGYPKDILVAMVDIADLLDDSYACIRGLEQMRAAGDDELTLSERASIGPRLMREMRRLQVRQAIAGQITAHECEAYLRGMRPL